jgi:hypothetical protein
VGLRKWLPSLGLTQNKAAMRGNEIDKASPPPDARPERRAESFHDILGLIHHLLAIIFYSGGLAGVLFTIIYSNIIAIYPSYLPTVCRPNTQFFIIFLLALLFIVTVGSLAKVFSFVVRITARLYFHYAILAVLLSSLVVSWMQVYVSINIVHAKELYWAPICIGIAQGSAKLASTVLAYGATLCLQLTIIGGDFGFLPGTRKSAPPMTEKFWMALICYVFWLAVSIILVYRIYGIQY